MHMSTPTGGSGGAPPDEARPHRRRGAPGGRGGRFDPRGALAGGGGGRAFFRERFRARAPPAQAEGQEPRSPPALRAEAGPSLGFAGGASQLGIPADPLDHHRSL